MRVDTTLGAIEIELAGEGPPAFLWHSLCTDRAVWSRVRETLGAHRRLVMIDAPGHGSSSTPAARFTIERCADVAIQLLDALGVDEPVDWVGNAWGGHVGVVLAAHEPSRLRTLTTIATLLGAIPERARLEVHALLAAHRLTGPSHFVISRLLPALLSSQTRARDDAAVAYVTGQISTIDPHAFRTAMRSVMLDRPNLTHHLPSLTMPTLLITGAEDRICTPAHVQAAEAEFANLKSAVIDGAAHLTALESPRETTAAILVHWGDSG